MRTPQEGRGRVRSLAVPLIALNAGLVVVLGIVTAAGAQPGARARGNYAMVGGEFLGGGGANAVYILDAANQELIAVKWDESRKVLDGIGYRDLSKDAQQRSGR